MMGFFSKIGGEVLAIGAAIIGGMLLFFSWRDKLITQGENQALARSARAAAQRANKGIRNAKNADNFTDDAIDRMLESTGTEFDDWGRSLPVTP